MQQLRSSRNRWILSSSAAKGHKHKGDKGGKSKGKDKEKVKSKGKVKGKHGHESKKKGNCHNCGKPGHYARDCWAKPAKNVNEVSCQAPATSATAAEGKGASGGIEEISFGVGYREGKAWIFVISDVYEVTGLNGDLLLDSGVCLCVAPKDFAKHSLSCS